jgi:putative transposase
MSQSLVKMYMHIVFSTKERFPFLTDESTRSQTHAYLGGILKNLESPALKIGGTADHVHILCTVSKNRLITRVVGEMKRASSIWIKGKGALLEKFQWQDGYGAFSVGQRDIDVIKNYIEHQIDHHRKKDFKQELLSLLKEYDLEYDERYLWD